MENDMGILTRLNGLETRERKQYPNADEMSRSSLADRLTIAGLSRERRREQRVDGWSSLAVR
jgi:hypothetical protein